MTTSLIVTVRPTIMDGPVIDWFLTEAAAHDVSRAIVSASRNGVHLDCWLHQIPGLLGLLETACQAAEACKRGTRTPELEQAYATHERSWGSRELTPIVRKRSRDAAGYCTQCGADPGVEHSNACPM